MYALDLQNLSVVVRSKESEKLEEQFVEFGHLDKNTLIEIFKGNQDVLQKNFCYNQLLKNIIQLALSRSSSKAMIEFDKLVNRLDNNFPLLWF